MLCVLLVYTPCLCFYLENVILGVCAFIGREKNAHIVCILLR